MKIMKSLLALCAFGCLVGFGNTPEIEARTILTVDDSEATYTLNTPENYAELLAVLNTLTSEEEVAAFLEKHKDFASNLKAATAKMVFSGGCDSWFNVAGCVQVRRCWVGVTSNGTKYGIYWQTRVTC